jgi:mono/diheme cytochrome c family protein
MDEQAKKKYLEQYEAEKKKGVPFFPDVLFKDALASLLVLLILIALSYFLGAPLEERANPADTTYTPRPEWYFLFLFQLLKYFPGQLEVLGVFVLPSLAIVLLFLLPFLDRSPRRHFRARPRVMGITIFTIIGIAVLSVLSILETPPPAEAEEGDPTAALYARNCAGCHGQSISVPANLNLHGVIAEGKHEGMPAWSADLTSDQIDALAGFVISPVGSQLFTENCGACHEAPELVAGDPLEFQKVLEQGPGYSSHTAVGVPVWAAVLNTEQRTALLNFLAAPDGQRLFATNCASCHGRAVAFGGEESELREIISQGGLHLEMPPWQEKLSSSEIDILANYVMSPASVPDGEVLFQQNCAACHGERIPASTDVAEARQFIATGGSHETMPVWGNLLTEAQLNALVSYTLETARGTPINEGRELYADNCALCHGDLGEGGANPTRPGDIIAPISSAEYLKTRDDATLRAIVAQGQPNFGMSPFGSAFGGPLDDDQVDAVVAFMRSWEANPPVELPPEVASTPISHAGSEIYSEVCAQCHGATGEGIIGPALNDPDLQARYTDEALFTTINRGHEATSMIGWGEILSSEQIQQLVEFIRELGGAGTPEVTTPPPSDEAVSYAANVTPIFEAKCAVCHGALGGWDASSYDLVMTSGNNAPNVIPGDVDKSILAQKLLNVQTFGALMPPAGQLPDDEIQVILDWIEAGALDN